MYEVEWKALEAAAATLLERFKDANIDTVEDVEVEAESDEFGSYVYLTLEGDLSLAMLRYLTDTDEASPTYGKFRVRLDSFVVDKLGLLPDRHNPYA